VETFLYINRVRAAFLSLVIMIIRKIKYL